MPGIDASIYQNLRPVEVPDFGDMQQKAMTLKQLGMQNDSMQREQEAKQRAQKVMALGQEMEQLAKLPPEQRPEYHAQKQQELVESGILHPNEALPYTEQNFQQGLVRWRSTPEFAALDKERATAEHLRAQAAKERAEKPEKIKGLAAEQSDKLGGFDSSLSMIGDLRKTLAANSDDFGPVAGRLASINPYNQRGQAVSALFKKAAQTIGKALEGGKLTDQDYAKYQKMLPTQADTPEVASAKLDQLERMIQEQRNSSLDVYGKAGLNVGQFAKTGVKEIGVAQPRGQDGAAYAAEAPKAPKVGAVEDGHVFMGGDPANPKSWKKAK